MIAILIAQAQDELEQALGFPRGEGGGGFIHHQNAALTVERAGDLHLLLFGDGQVITRSLALNWAPRRSITACAG